MKNPLLTLISLRWDVDQLVKNNIIGGYWWLKPCIVDDKRIGITECCKYEYECIHHKQIREKLENQYDKLGLS